MATVVAVDGDFRHLAADCRHPTPSEYRVNGGGGGGVGGRWGSRGRGEAGRGGGGGAS